MVLIPLSALFSQVRACLRGLTVGMTSDSDADEELTPLVNSSKGARADGLFQYPHWFAVNLAVRSYSAAYAHMARFCAMSVNMQGASA